uniref:Kinesin motor domain-containing protein n=1 Tax=Ascaris lumbricoides TaxID=6252 RepID=A0A0M3HV43_ASCLU
MRYQSQRKAALLIYAYVGARLHSDQSNKAVFARKSHFYGQHWLISFFSFFLQALLVHLLEYLNFATSRVILTRAIKGSTQRTTAPRNVTDASMICITATKSFLGKMKDDEHSKRFSDGQIDENSSGANGYKEKEAQNANRTLADLLIEFLREYANQNGQLV